MYSAKAVMWACGVLSLVVASVQAQGRTEDRTRRSDPDRNADLRDQSTTGRSSQTDELRYAPTLRRATRLIGRGVIDVHGNPVGRVDDLGIDAGRGVVGFAIIAREGVVGSGERLVAVPFRSLRYTGENRRLVLQTDRALLDHVPGLEDNYSLLSNSQWASDLFSQFNQQPYWESGYSGRGGSRQGYGMRSPRFGGDREVYGYSGDRDVDDSSGIADFDLDLDIDVPQAQKRDQDRERARDEMEHREYQQERRQGSNVRPMRNLAETPQGPGEIIMASDILLESIRDVEGERAGHLRDLMVDVRTGGVGYGVVTDNSLMHDRLYAVPWNAFGLTREHDEQRLALDMPRNALRHAPSFDDDNWPNMSSVRWNEDVHRYYGVQPTWMYYGYVGPVSGSQDQQPLFSQESQNQTNQGQTTGNVQEQGQQQTDQTPSTAPESR